MRLEFDEDRADIILLTLRRDSSLRLNLLGVSSGLSSAGTLSSTASFFA